jgi:hypothetical protein
VIDSKKVKIDMSPRQQTIGEQERWIVRYGLLKQPYRLAYILENARVIV